MSYYLLRDLIGLDPPARIKMLERETHVVLRGEIAAVARILADYANVRISELTRYAIARLALDFPDIRGILLRYVEDEKYVDKLLDECRKLVERLGA